MDASVQQLLLDYESNVRSLENLSLDNDLQNFVSPEIFRFLQIDLPPLPRPPAPFQPNAQPQPRFESSITEKELKDAV